MSVTREDMVWAAVFAAHYTPNSAAAGGPGEKRTSLARSAKAWADGAVANLNLAEIEDRIELATARAATVLGSREAGLAWMDTPSPMFNHDRPVSFARSESGLEFVMQRLWALGDEKRRGAECKTEQAGTGGGAR